MEGYSNREVYEVMGMEMRDFVRELCVAQQIKRRTLTRYGCMQRMDEEKKLLRKYSGVKYGYV